MTEIMIFSQSVNLFGPVIPDLTSRNLGLGVKWSNRKAPPSERKCDHFDSLRGPRSGDPAMTGVKQLLSVGEEKAPKESKEYYDVPWHWSKGKVL